MQPQSDTEYKQLLTDVIKKQIVILGPDITLIKARNVPGLTVDNEGTVTAITGEPQQITQALIDQFVQLSGLIVKKTMEPLLMYHPTESAQAPLPQQPPVQIPSVQTQQSSPTAPVQTPQPVNVQVTVPPMPEGTQPVSDTTAQQVSQPLPTPEPSTPQQNSAAPEIDMETQQIINDALKQT